MRTVRSAASSRNRPRRRLAWLIIFIVLVLIALAARVDAAPGAAPIDLAIRYADVLTGAETGAVGTSAADGDDDDDGEADAAAERAAELDDDDGSDDDDAVGRDLVELAGLGGVGQAQSRPPGDTTGDEPLADPDDGEDDGEPASLAMAGDDGPDAPDALPADAGSGALAMRDAELDPGDPIAGMDAAEANAPAGAAEVYEQSMRHARPSRWGRLDVGVAWRSRWSEPMHAPVNRYSELWLVATWRR